MLSLLLVLSSLALGPPPTAPADPAPPVKLEDAVRTALARSPVRQAAEARRDAAKTAVPHAGAWPNPLLELRGENWTMGHWYWTPRPDVTAQPGVDFFAVLSQPIPLGGRLGAQQAIAGAERDGAEAGLSQAERSVALETVRLFLDVVRSRDLLKALDSNRDGLDTLLRAMTARVREGYAAGADLAKFQAELARVQTQSLRARVDLGRSLALLNGLLRDTVPVSADQLVEPVAYDPPAGDAAVLEQRAVDRSPDVQAARARAVRAAQALALERAKRLPDMAVAGGYKRTAGENTAVLGVTLALPLFDTNTQAVATAAGEARAASFELADAEARARAEARAILEAARTLAERARRVDDDLLKPADIVRTAARAAFREGAADILNLVDAERVYVEARREALQLKLDATAAAIEARLLLGEETLR